MQSSLFEFQLVLFIKAKKLIGWLPTPACELDSFPSGPVKVCRKVLGSLLVDVVTESILGEHGVKSVIGIFSLTIVKPHI